MFGGAMWPISTSADGRISCIRDLRRDMLASLDLGVLDVTQESEDKGTTVRLEMFLDPMKLKM